MDRRNRMQRASQFHPARAGKGEVVGATFGATYVDIDKSRVGQIAVCRATFSLAILAAEADPLSLTARRGN